MYIFGEPHDCGYLSENVVDEQSQRNATLACLIYIFSLSFSNSFAFQTDKFTSSYICNKNDKWNDILNDGMMLKS